MMTAFPSSFCPCGTLCVNASEYFCGNPVMLRTIGERPENRGDTPPSLTLNILRSHQSPGEPPQPIGPQGN